MFPVIRNSAQWKEVRNKIDLVRVARELLGEPEEKSGDTFYWSCPFHGETEPSFQITEGRYLWKCPACDRWGDAVDLVRHGKGLEARQCSAGNDGRNGALTGTPRATRCASA